MPLALRLSEGLGVTGATVSAFLGVWNNSIGVHLGQ